MARTKASVVGKVFSGKSSAKVSKSQPKTPSSKSSSSGSSYGTGGNPYCPRETPNWQKPITNFFCGPVSKPDEDGEVPSSSKADAVKRKRKTMAISSDTESDNEGTNVDKPAISNKTDANGNSETFLNESCDRLDNSDSHLLPLTDDESCHKIGEYFNANGSTKNISNSDKKKNAEQHDDSLIDVADRENETNDKSEDIIKVKLGMFKNKGKGKGKKSSNSDDNSGADNRNKDDIGDAKNTEKENLKPINVNKIKPMDSHKIDLGKKHELDEGISDNISKK